MIGVVADDTTGANDIGIMFTNNNYSVKIVTFQEDDEHREDVDVLVLDTDSRLDPNQLSYDKVYKSTKQLEKLGCSLYFNKTCSVFRGNIGVEFDAMLDALNQDFAVVSLAFPKNGRTTINGIHRVRGVKLENSEFAKDPVHPMKDSNLINILQEQTERKVSLITLDTVRQGALILREALLREKESSNYCIVDSENQEDLAIVAAAIHDFPVICGSSAIAEELPKFYPKKNNKHIVDELQISDSNGVLVVSGSLTPQTKAQTKFLMDQGVSTVVMDSRKVFDDKEKEIEISSTVAHANELLARGEDVLVMADNSEENVVSTKVIGEKQHGMDPLSISKLVSATLSEIAYQIVDDRDLKRLVIAGGDTSGTLCRKLGIKGNYVLKEIETGLPSGLALGEELLIVLKSGSFGKEAFLSEAIKHLKAIG